MHKIKFIQCVMYILGDQHEQLQWLCVIAERTEAKKKRFQTTRNCFHARYVFRQSSSYLVFSCGDFKKIHK